MPEILASKSETYYSCLYLFFLALLELLLLLNFDYGDISPFFVGVDFFTFDSYVGRVEGGGGVDSDRFVTFS